MKLTQDQKRKIWAAFLAGGGTPELAPTFLKWICEIVESPGKRTGRPREKPDKLAKLREDIERLQRRNPRLSKNAIAKQLQVHRNKVARAMADPAATRILFLKRARRFFPRGPRVKPKTPLSE